MLRQPSCGTLSGLGLEPLFAACSLHHSHCNLPQTTPACPGNKLQQEADLFLRSHSNSNAAVAPALSTNTPLVAGIECQSFHTTAGNLHGHLTCAAISVPVQNRRGVETHECTCVPSSSNARIWVATLSRSQRSWEIITTDPANSNKSAERICCRCIMASSGIPLEGVAH